MRTEIHCTISSTGVVNTLSKQVHLLPLGLITDKQHLTSLVMNILLGAMEIYANSNRSYRK